MRHRAILFDVDGTLLDTREYIFQAYEHAFATHGFPAPRRERLALMVGRPLEECYLELAPGGDPLALCAAHREFQAVHPHLSRVFPGIRAMLAALRTAGIRTAAVTSRKLTARQTLDYHEIDGLLEVVLDGGDVEQHKPHPEPVLKALVALGVGPAEAVMVGDAPVDIEAGRSAGTATIGVTYGFHGELIRHARPDALASSPRELRELLLGSE